MTAYDGLIRSKPATGRRHLLVVRAGDDSLHSTWISAGQRNFDLLVSYYGTITDAFKDHADHYHVMRGPRWPAHHAICRANQALISAYESVCFACDDLNADTTTWNELFEFCQAHALDLAQPAILGATSYQITMPIEDVLYRTTTFVENMCPVFSKRALDLCRPTFGESISGWGLNHIWPKILLDRGCTLAVIDSIRLTHTRALQEGSLYGVLRDLGIDPWREMKRVMARYGIAQPDIRELSRVSRR